MTHSPSAELAAAKAPQARSGLLAGLGALALAAITVGLRLYRLDALLWFDELYTIQLARLGPWAIWLNSANDTHPVLFYLSEWLASGFGAAGPAWAWRLLPAACGAAAVLVVYATGRPLAGAAGSLAGCLAMAISPTGIYFSQEARSSSMVVLLSAVALLLASRLALAPRRSTWLLYGALCLVGIATNYFFVLVPAAQLAVLLARRPTRRAAAICAAAVGLASLPALALAYRTIRRVIGSGAPPPPMSLVQLGQGLTGGEPLRYGYTWGHSAILAALLALALAGVWPGRRRLEPLAWLCLAQIGLPLIGFYGLALPVLNIHAQPPLIIKTFISLQPAIYLLAALGAGRLLAPPARPYGAALLGAAGALLVAGCVPNLGRYWSVSKSPEAELVLAVGGQLQPGDVVVSGHYSLSAALGYYAPGAAVYTGPVQVAGAARYSRSTQVLLNPPTQPPADVRPETILAAPRIWLLSYDGWPLSQPFAAMMAACSPGPALLLTPFRAVPLTGCP